MTNLCGREEFYAKPTIITDDLREQISDYNSLGRIATIKGDWSLPSTTMRCCDNPMIFQAYHEGTGWIFGLVCDTCGVFDHESDYQPPWPFNEDAANPADMVAAGFRVMYG